RSRRLAGGSTSAEGVKRAEEECSSCEGAALQKAASIHIVSSLTESGSDSDAAIQSEWRMLMTWIGVYKMKRSSAHRGQALLKSMPIAQSGVPRNGWDHGRQNGFTNAPFAATSHTATRAHFHPFALARHSKVLLPNSRVSANSMTSRRVD